MTSPVEQAGKAVNTFFEVMKQQPIALSLVIMNLGLLGFLYYGGVVAHREREIETKLLYENRDKVAKLLFDCYPTPPQSKVGG